MMEFAGRHDITVSTVTGGKRAPSEGEGGAGRG